ncbi:MAG: hypothetical protein ACQETM_00710 [Bacteroidota bacterium]
MPPRIMAKMARLVRKVFDVLQQEFADEQKFNGECNICMSIPPMLFRFS